VGKRDLDEFDRGQAAVGTRVTDGIGGERMCTFDPLSTESFCLREEKRLFLWLER